MRFALTLLLLAACGGSGTSPAVDAGSMLCGPGMICGNSGGVPGNFCCYPQPGMPSYYCPD